MAALYQTRYAQYYIQSLTVHLGLLSYAAIACSNYFLPCHQSGSSIQVRIVFSHKRNHRTLGWADFGPFASFTKTGKRGVSSMDKGVREVARQWL